MTTLRGRCGKGEGRDERGELTEDTRGDAENGGGRGKERVGREKVERRDRK